MFSNTNVHFSLFLGSTETVERSDAAQKSVGGNPEASRERSFSRNSSGKLLSIIGHTSRIRCFELFFNVLLPRLTNTGLIQMYFLWFK